MKIRDLVSMALRNLAARKLRTFLTVLGVFIGATSIIIMLSIGFGFKKINADMIARMGDMKTLDLHTDFAWSEESEANAKNAKKKKLNDAAIKEVKKIENVKAVIPIYSGYMQIRSGRYEGFSSFTAIPNEEFENYGLKIVEGNLPRKNANEFIFGGGVTQSMSDPKRSGFSGEKLKPLKSKFSIFRFNPEFPTDNNNMDGGGAYTEEDPSENSPQKEPPQVPIKVVGLLENNPNNWMQNSSIFMSIDTFKDLSKSFGYDKKVSKLKQYNNIKVVVDDIKNVESVQSQIKSLGYNPSNMAADFLKQSNQQIEIIQVVFGGIGAISFIVAAIGITNTMIMSIYERTKEIGVMKVIGASIRDIQKLFLVEAGIIGAIGGIVSVIFSLIASKIINYFFGGFFMSMAGEEGAMIDPKLSLITPFLIISSILFSTFIGVLSGYLPARRAMKLSALDAIRTE